MDACVGIVCYINFVEGVRKGSQERDGNQSNRHEREKSEERYKGPLRLRRQRLTKKVSDPGIKEEINRQRERNERDQSEEGSYVIGTEIEKRSCDCSPTL